MSSGNPLRHRDFALLLAGRLVSQTGTQMMHVALLWHVYRLSDGNPLALGAIGLARAVPLIVTALFGGVLADAYDRRRLLIGTQIGFFAISSALAAVTIEGDATLWILYAATALGGVAIALDNPARQAIVANVVPEAELSRAMSQSSTAFNVARIAGPAAGGLALAAWDVGVVYAIDAATFLVMLGCMVALRYRPEQRPAVRPGLAAMIEGFAYLRRQPVVWSTMLLDFFATFFADALLLLPIFANEIFHRGAAGLGWLTSAHGMGAVAAGLTLSFMRLPKRQGAVVIVAIFFYGLAYAAFGFSRNFWLSMALLAAAGAADTVSAVVRMTLRQLLTPDALRGRMNSINMIFFAGGPQLGEMEAGALASFVGARWAVRIGGFACLLTSAAFGLYRPLRSYRSEDRP